MIKDKDKFPVPVGREPSVDQVITFTTSTACDDPFAADTRFIRVISSAACYLKFGTAPTAVVTSKYLPADTAEYFAVVPGQKVAALAV